MSNGTNNLSRTSTILRSEAAKKSLGTDVMAYVLPKYKQEDFTGQVYVEVHVKDGVICDVYQSVRRKRKEDL